MTDKEIAFQTRFREKIDAKLRDRIFRRGELFQLIVLILQTVDLKTIPLLELGSEFGAWASTSVKLPTSLHKKLKKVAIQRETSMNVLLNSAVWAYDLDHPEADPD